MEGREHARVCIRGPNEANANRVLDHLMHTVDSLARFPERGSYPKELLAQGIKEYRQITSKPCRVHGAKWSFT